MKELSIEEKAKRYDEAIEIAKEINDEQRAQPFNVMLKVFPELKESDDERIRKAIKLMYSFLPNKPKYIGDVSVEDMFTWLENQCENHIVGNNEMVKPIDKVEPKFKVGDKIRCKLDDRTFVIKEVDLEKGEYLYTKSGCGNDINYADETFELVEQKPAWSEEDEEMVEDIIEAIDTQYAVTDYNEMVSWLKSLKERYTWKPSDEQMDTLEYYMHTLICNEHKKVLFGLYADLKKLREE